MSNIVSITGPGESVTMTSLDLVDFINSERSEGEAELRHADFLAKVPKVLGLDERKFSSVYKGGNGQERPCYVFPKREACLMAMSYSYDLQAKVFDRIASSDGSLCLTDAAKTLQVQPRKLTQLLSEKGWLYRRPMGSGWLAYQDRIQQGLLEHKVTTGEKSDGTEWSSTQVRVTAKGLTKLADVVRQVGMH